VSGIRWPSLLAPAALAAGLFLSGPLAVADGDGELRYADFIDAMRKSDLVVVWEGLPRDPDGAAAAAKSPDDKSFQIGDQSFYSHPVPLTGQETAAVTEAIGRRDSFKPWSAFKYCYGFHADYAIEWRSRGVTLAEALLCFGCGEARFYVGDLTELVDQSDDGAKQFHALLRSHHHAQPANPPDSVAPPADLRGPPK
jgi:hypothetical protein